MIFSFIETEKVHHSIGLMCRVLKVSRSGYYAWKVRPPCRRERNDDALRGRIRQTHHDSRDTYGAPRIHVRLRAELEDAHAANRENRRIIAALTSRIPEIEALRGEDSSPYEPREEPESPSPSETPTEVDHGLQEPPERSWWRRIFGG